MIWGDLGRLYVWIPQPALDARTWSATWTQVQCS
jgi:uncharacterized protein YwqG